MWKLEASLGGVKTTGNTETTTLQGGVDAQRKHGGWENRYVFNSLEKEEQVTDEQGAKTRQTSARKYFGSAKSSYLVGADKSYVFGYVSYADDRFGAYRTYATASAGYGKWLFSTLPLKWFVEAGPGYFQGKKPLDDAADAYVRESGALLHIASELTWAISGNAEFKQLLTVETAGDNTRTVGETSLTTSITDAMKMKVGVNIASDSKVAPDKAKTDTTTFINLVFSL